MWLTIRAANNQINTVLQISYWVLIGCYHCLTVDRFSLSLGSSKWQMTKQDLITPWLLLSLLRKIQVYLQIYKKFSINYIDNRLRLCKKTSWASLRDLATTDRDYVSLSQTFFHRIYEFWHVIIVPKPWSKIIQDSRILFLKNQHMDGIS